jgi:hypothetical protein
MMSLSKLCSIYIRQFVFLPCSFPYAFFHIFISDKTPQLAISFPLFHIAIVFFVLSKNLSIQPSRRVVLSRTSTSAVQCHDPDKVIDLDDVVDHDQTSFSTKRPKYAAFLSHRISTSSYRKRESPFGRSAIVVMFCCFEDREHGMRRMETKCLCMRGRDVGSGEGPITAI